jgi:hypothetical protein
MTFKIFFNKILVFISAVLLLPLIFLSCSNNKYYSSPEEVIQTNIDYMNTEDLDGVMSTIHPDSPSFKTTENLAKQLFKIYDLNYKIEKLEVINENNQEATVNFTQLTTKISGPQFKNNRIQGVHIVRKDGDSWKLYSTKILNTEFLN